MAHPQAVALAEPCPHEIPRQRRVASRPPSACVCVRAGVYACSALETGWAASPQRSREGPDLIELGGGKTLGLGRLGHVSCE